MTEKEKFMYKIMGKISESDVPIVFKGALVTKLILTENGYTALERQTKDIDANWVDTPPSMDVLVEAINNSLGEFKNEMYAVAFREYGTKTSAGISIRGKDTDEEIISMDISVKPVHGNKIYHYGEISIKGVLANEILSDKITVMSKKMIFRRAKDIVDVYALAHCVRVRTSEIFEIFRKNPNREVGIFDEFYNHRQEVEHAYEKLEGIEDKPKFDGVYSYLKNFVRPFAEKDMIPKVWDNGKAVWENECRERKPTMLEKLHKHKEEIKQNEQNHKNDTPKLKKNDIDL